MSLVETYNIKIKKQEDQGISIADVAKKVDKHSHRYSGKTLGTDTTDVAIKKEDPDTGTTNVAEKVDKPGHGYSRHSSDGRRPKYKYNRCNT